MLSKNQLTQFIMGKKEIYGICKFVNTGLAIGNTEGEILINLETEDGQNYWITANDKDVHDDIVVGRHYYASGEENTIASGLIQADYVDQWGRYCDHCGAHMSEGYYSENTCMYFCSDECLRAEYTQEEIDEEMIDEDGNGYLYWTEWE